MKTGQWIAIPGLLLVSGLAQLAVGQSSAAVSAERATLKVQVPSVVLRSYNAGHTDPNKTLDMAVSLEPGNLQGLEDFARNVSNPSSRLYRQYLTPEEVGERFGAPLSTVLTVASYLKSNGLHVKLVAKNRLSILCSGTVTNAEKAFGTTINNYESFSLHESGNPHFYSFSTPPTLPTGIASAVLDVSGLESFTKPIPRQVLTPTQTRVLYNTAPAYNAGLQGQNRTVGISNWDGYRLSNVPLYYAQYGLPTPPGGVGANITVVTISGGAGGGTPGAEGDLDIQMVLGMAPLCSLRVYDGGNSDLIGVLTSETNDNLADVISESYGWNLSASTATSAHNLHLSMSSQGITYMAASGDSGTSLEPYSYPDYDPEVLMVGGTIATTDSSGNRTSEVGWSGSGGGWSTNTASFNTLPSWQVGNGVPTGNNHRLVPDVALHASGGTTGAYFFYFNGSLTSGYVGTSFASPVFAGSLAVAEQKIISLGGLPPNGAGKQRFGRIQDVFYAQNGRSDVWHDITSGSNGTLPNGSTSNAGTGWDYVCGWGSINFDAFVGTQTSSSPDFSIAASPSSQTVLQGNGTSYTATVTALNGFTGTVSFSSSGLPSGASGSFNPTSVVGSGSSTFSVSTSASTPAGSYPVTITGTSGSLVHSTSVTLVVTAPVVGDFTISASPPSRTIRHGNSTTYTVTITGTGGFNGTVGLSASGLGPNSSASFNPTSVTGSGFSTMTVMTQGRVSRGTFTITIKGTSGSLVHTTTVTLTVT